MLRTTALLLALLAASAPLRAADDLERASRLRDEASAAWNAGDYAEAAAKLHEADRIYEGRSDVPLADRAITLRALTWNLSKQDLARETWEAWSRLADIAAGKPKAYDDVWSAFVAVVEVARRMDQAPAVSAYLAPLRQKARECNYPYIAAQVCHDLGSILRDRGEPEQSIEMYEQAVAERKELGDHLGMAWSLINITNIQVDRGMHQEALKPLLHAYAVVHTREVFAPQTAVVWNLRKVLAWVEKNPGEKGVAAGLWKLGETAVETETPKVIPADHLLRIALRADPTKKAAERVGKSGLFGCPNEVKADLVIRAARIGGGTEAVTLLSKLKVGDGPARPHLEARRKTELAVLLAGLKKREPFAKQAKAAAEAFRGMEDRAGREGALGRIVEAARSAGFSEIIAEIAAEYEKLRSIGKPGGMGSSVSSAGDRSGFGNLGFHDPLFAVSLGVGTAEKPKVRIEDLLAKQTRELDMDWRPRSLTLNGVAFRTFGGYVAITSFAYGGASISTSTPGTLTLDEMGEYLPLPAKGRILILKNGAIRYELE